MAGIYLERDGELVNLCVEPFGSGDEFQSLIEHHGQLLAGDQINRSSPRRFLLVRREAGIPSEATESDRWSVAHLFIDHDAVPTVVEVKRSTDTRIRREVVGQMLDYAANASAHWPEGRLRSEFEATCSEAPVDPVERLSGSPLGDTAFSCGCGIRDGKPGHPFASKRFATSVLSSNPRGPQVRATNGGRRRSGCVGGDRRVSSV